MVKTDEVLRTLLKMGFGCVSLNEAMFRGRGCTDPCIPKSYFATDRLGKHDCVGNVGVSPRLATAG